MIPSASTKPLSSERPPATEAVEARGFGVVAGAIEELVVIDETVRMQVASGLSRSVAATMAQGIHLPP
jgi:hypothetical protein